jgi:hypothetical protein
MNRSAIGKIRSDVAIVLRCIRSVEHDQRLVKLCRRGASSSQSSELLILECRQGDRRFVVEKLSNAEKVYQP